MTAFRTEEVLKVSVAVVNEMYNLENRTQYFFKTIILAAYFDTSFISQVFKVEDYSSGESLIKPLFCP